MSEQSAENNMWVVLGSVLASYAGSVMIWLQVRQHAESTGGHLANCAARRHYAADSALAAASAAATARSHSASAPGGADCDAMCAPYLVVTPMDAADAAAGIAPRASAVELLHKSLQGNVDVSEEQAEYERRFTR